MELGTLTRLFALISSVLLTLTTVPVHTRARCRGRWRIHACLGGNGKRSDPRLSVSSQTTLASRLREARRLALRSAVHSGYESPRPFSLLSRLQPDSVSHISDKLLASELAAWLQEDNGARDKDDRAAMHSATNVRGDDDFTVNDVSTDAEDMTPVDMETVQDIFTALTLQRALGRQGSSGKHSDTRDLML